MSIKKRTDNETNRVDHRHGPPMVHKQFVFVLRSSVACRQQFHGRLPVCGLGRRGVDHLGESSPKSAERRQVLCMPLRIRSALEVLVRQQYSWVSGAAAPGTTAATLMDTVEWRTGDHIGLSETAV